MDVAIATRGRRRDRPTSSRKRQVRRRFRRSSEGVVLSRRTEGRRSSGRCVADELEGGWCRCSGRCEGGGGDDCAIDGAGGANFCMIVVPTLIPLTFMGGGGRGLSSLPLPCCAIPSVSSFCSFLV